MINLIDWMKHKQLILTLHLQCLAFCYLAIHRDGVGGITIGASVDVIHLTDDTCSIDGQSGAIGLIFASANQTALQYDNGVIMKNPFQSPTTFAQEAR